jgi:hypothetical protein
MKNLTLFLAGLFVGILCCRPRRAELGKLALDVEELASPSIYRRTILLRLDPVPQGSPQTTH